MATLIYLLLDMIEPEAEGSVSRSATLNSQRLFGCHSNTVYGQSQLLDGNICTLSGIESLRAHFNIIVYCLLNH